MCIPSYTVLIILLNVRILWCYYQLNHCMTLQLLLSRLLCSVCSVLTASWCVTPLYALQCAHCSAVEFAKECDASVLADITEDEVYFNSSLQVVALTVTTTACTCVTVMLFSKTGHTSFRCVQRCAPFAMLMGVLSARHKQQHPSSCA
jgi:hypothetical protein